MTSAPPGHRAGHVASLRVYEPLAAFEGAERERWEAYVASGAAPSPAAAVAMEHAAALRALVGRPPVTVPELAEHAYVTEVDGMTLVCPWRTRLRSLEALEEFLAGVPDELIDAWVPRSLADGLGEQVDALRLSAPEQRPGILTATWHVPLKWFVLVDSKERQVSLGPG